jgi:hypothetical protein
MTDRTFVFHEVRPESLDELRRDGIRRGGSGEKTGGPEQGADTFLDSARSPAEVQRGLSRHDVVYGYLSDGDRLIDIQDGKAVDPPSYAAEREQVLVRMTVDSDRCFVSDLDCYDVVKEGLQSGWSQDALLRWAARYWKQVTPLSDYRPGLYRRPEVMITVDVPPRDIVVVPTD